MSWRWDRNAPTKRDHFAERPDPGEPVDVAISPDAGRAPRAIERLEGAADACRQAIKLEPANLPCRQLLIRCYLRLGDKSAARGELDACLILMPPAERETFGA